MEDSARVSDTGQCEDVGDLDCLASVVAAPGRVFGGTFGWRLQREGPI